MLDLAFGLLCAAALLGGALAALYLRGPRAKRPTASLPAAHGVLGAAALAALTLALRRGVPETAMGLSGFGRTAAGLLIAALLFGLLLARATWHGRRPNELLVGTHAGLAIAGFVLVLALVALR